MKTKLPLIALFLTLGVLLGAAFAPSRIRWDWNGGSPVDWWGVNGSKVQLGLRDDGIVVWREITTATNVIVTTTNSPAEVLDQQQQGIYYWTNSPPQWPTNIVLTNWIRPL